MNQKEESFRMRDKGARHCYFVISKVDAEGKVLVVNCSTYRRMRGEDTTCIIRVGEHDFIKEESYSPYNYAKIMDYSEVQKLNPVRDVSVELYEKLREGCKMSDYTPQYILSYILSH